MSNYQKIEFIIIYVNVKFNLNRYKYHGHENTHVNLPLHIHVGELKKNEVVIKMEIIKLGNEVVVSKLFLELSRDNHTIRS